ncbi:hypothetical protein EDD22DRAFT_875506 [Suillus occidentalis]|nr:hypothetical protein EDD22DRAFT_875506 [Suillus occidentalis]
MDVEPRSFMLSESAVKDKQKFERLVASKEDLLKMFSVSSGTGSWSLPRCLRE